MTRCFPPLFALLGLAATACNERPAQDWWAWITPGRLVAAAAPERAPRGPDQWMTVLQEAADGKPLAVLNLREKAYPELASKMAATLHVPIPDFSPPSRDQADRALAFIRENMDRGRVVVVHCHGGCGRTGTILAAHLKRTGGLTASAAIERLRRLRSCLVETEGQEGFVASY